MRPVADYSGDAPANIGRDYANTGYEMPREKVVNQEFRLLGFSDCCLAPADNRPCQQGDFHGRLGFGRRVIVRRALWMRRRIWYNRGEGSPRQSA